MACGIVVDHPRLSVHLDFSTVQRTRRGTMGGLRCSICLETKTHCRRNAVTRRCRWCSGGGMAQAMGEEHPLVGCPRCPDTNPVDAARERSHRPRWILRLKWKFLWFRTYCGPFFVSIFLCPHLLYMSQYTNNINRYTLITSETAQPFRQRSGSAIRNSLALPLRSRSPCLQDQLPPAPPRLQCLQSPNLARRHWSRILPRPCQ